MSLREGDVTGVRVVREPLPMVAGDNCAAMKHGDGRRSLDRSRCPSSRFCCGPSLIRTSR